MGKHLEWSEKLYTCSKRQGSLERGKNNFETMTAKNWPKILSHRLKKPCNLQTCCMKEQSKEKDKLPLDEQ